MLKVVMTRTIINVKNKTLIISTVKGQITVIVYTYMIGTWMQYVGRSKKFPRTWAKSHLS